MPIHKLVGIIAAVCVSALLFGPAAWFSNLGIATESVFGDDMYTGRAITGVLLAYGLPYLGAAFLIFPEFSSRKLSPRSGAMYNRQFSPGLFVVFGYVCLAVGSLILFAFY